MILLMKSEVSAERFILNAENLPQKALFKDCSEIMDKRGPRFYMAKPLLIAAWLAESARAGFMGTKPGLTLENVRSVTGINRYTAVKFSNQFGYEFIPIRESLKYALNNLGLAKAQ